MYSIKTLNKIAACGTEQLPAERFSVSDDAKNPDGIILRSYNMKEEDLTPGLKVIARAGVGVNNIPVELCAEKGIVVLNTPGANANAVMELVIAGLLLSSRKIVSGIHWTLSLAGNPDVEAAVEKGKSAFTGPEIAGKVLGVIGLGNIGGLVANACRSLGMRVIGYDPFMSVEAAWNLSRGIRRAANEDAVYAEADYLTVHIPANKETKNKFNAEFFAKCKKGVRIFNFSRASLFNNAALIEAIKNGVVECYVTDFPTADLLDQLDELHRQNKIIAIPHLGASTPETEDNCATMAAVQLREYLSYGNIANSVNFPDCQLPWNGKKRICVIHKNVVNVIGNVTKALAEKGINIDNMQNRSRGDYAYTIIDIDEDADGLEEVLKNQEAIIDVRVI